jgi:hypothetical protein
MYTKIYVSSSRGQAALHDVRVGGHISTWAGCDQADGSWIGVVYPTSAQARQELDALDGVTVFPSHLHDEDELTAEQQAAMPQSMQAAALTNVPGQETLPLSGRQFAKKLHEELGHPALHPDT